MAKTMFGPGRYCGKAVARVLTCLRVVPGASWSSMNATTRCGPETAARDGVLHRHKKVTTKGLTGHLSQKRGRSEGQGGWRRASRPWMMAWCGASAPREPPLGRRMHHAYDRESLAGSGVCSGDCFGRSCLLSERTAGRRSVERRRQPVVVEVRGAERL